MLPPSTRHCPGTAVLTTVTSTRSAQSSTVASLLATQLASLNTYVPGRISVVAGISGVLAAPGVEPPDTTGTSKPASFRAARCRSTLTQVPVHADSCLLEGFLVEPRGPVEEPAEFAARLCDRHHLLRGGDAGAPDADVHLDHGPDAGQAARGLDGVDDDGHPAVPGQRPEPRQLLGHDRVGDQHVVSRQHLGLADLGHRDAGRARRELHARDLRDLVRLGVRPQRDAPAPALLRHAGDVALERVEVHVDGGCVEIESVHPRRLCRPFASGQAGGAAREITGSSARPSASSSRSEPAGPSSSMPTGRPSRVRPAQRTSPGSLAVRKGTFLPRISTS